MKILNKKPNKIVEENKARYKTFEEQFKLCALGLNIAFIYPSAHNRRKRIICYIMVCLTVFPACLTDFGFMQICLQRHDMENFTAQVTIIMVVMIYVSKNYIAIVNDKKLKAILNLISVDLLKANDLEEDYQKIYDEFIKLGINGQRALFVIALVFATLFPIFSFVATSFAYIFTEAKDKYMVHKVEIKMFADTQNDSPFFELFWVYQTYCCMIMSPSFVGFDSSFAISCCHLSLKLKLVAHKLDKIFKIAINKTELRERLNEAINDHREAFAFYDKVQAMYGDWLFVVYMLSSSIISLNLYQISCKKGINPKFTIFTLCAIIHIFAPCHFAAVLYKVGNDMPADIYNCSWENWSDPQITKTISFMVARAQRPLAITARDFVTFNMELFVSILQASYSFYTLIRS